MSVYLKKRRKTRIMLVQVVYMFVFDESSKKEMVKNSLLDFLKLQDSNIIYDEAMFNNVFTFIIENLSYCDSLIVQNINEKWDISRLDLIMHAILRVSIGEFLYFPDVHKNIIIDEYVSIAKLFIDDDKVNFINGIMDSISKKLREVLQPQKI